MAESETERPALVGTGAKAALAVLLIVLAALFAVLYRSNNASEHHSYNAGAAPPIQVRLTQGNIYEISTPGGMAGLLARGASPTALNCNFTNGTETRQLDVTPLGTDTRATHAVATFTAPESGSMRIECRGLTSTFIDDADDAGSDPAGRYLLLCIISLTLGVTLWLSVLYRRGSDRVSERDRPDDTDDKGAFGHLLATPTDG